MGNGKPFAYAPDTHINSTLSPLADSFTSLVCIFSQNEYGETAVLGACRGGHAETARILVEYSANVDYQNKVGRYTDNKCCTTKLILHYSLVDQHFGMQALLVKQTVQKYC